jgi:hypothetical protein
MKEINHVLSPDGDPPREGEVASRAVPAGNAVTYGGPHYKRHH